jgi:hypothetical protein
MKQLWIGTQLDAKDRTIITISDEDYQRTLRNDPSDPAENAKIFRLKNLSTGKMVKIKHAPCGLNCYCAMKFVK